QAYQSHDRKLVLEAREKRKLTLDEYAFSPGHPLYRSILEINGELPFSGYFTYTKMENKEPASFPLIAAGDLASELIMPHYPATSDWWTGIGIFNPLVAEPQTIYIKPYGAEGELLPDMIKTLDIAGGGYETFIVAAVYADKADDISFIKFRTEDGNGLAGGFYLYGSKYRNGGVSGGVMGH
ncbi:MAG: hypothetical protein ACQES8_06640, partial [Thermodesulfobacteriota bacterium]